MKIITKLKEPFLDSSKLIIILNHSIDPLVTYLLFYFNLSSLVGICSVYFLSEFVSGAVSPKVLSQSLNPPPLRMSIPWLFPPPYPLELPSILYQSTYHRSLVFFTTLSQMVSNASRLLSDYFVLYLINDREGRQTLQPSQ